MRDDDFIEARMPERAVRMTRTAAGEGAPRASALAPLGAMLSGPIFTRTRDIIAANMADLIDRAEDPARMIRMIINEMEETLVEVRATAARSIADLKEMRRAVGSLGRIASDWTERAGLALEKGREDLARAALGEKAKVSEMIDGLNGEIAQIEAVLKGYEHDIHQLQSKLAEARSRQASIASRIESAMTRAKARELVNGQRTAAAFARFELLERRADLAEGRADALGLAGPRSLEEEFAELRAAEQVDAELAALKADRAGREPQEGEQ